MNSDSDGELRFGATDSARKSANHARVDDFLRYFQVAAISQQVAAHDGYSKAMLRAAGTPIPDNDLWIAATALEHGQTLVTQDAHFSAIEGLKTAGW